MNSFSLLPKPLQKILADRGFNVPTSIQNKVIPIALAEKNFMAKSATGSGKTLAFVLPALVRLKVEHRFPQILVLTPTRELAIQIITETRKISPALPGTTTASLVGGLPHHEQFNQLESGAQFIVGTPGRILDHIRKGSLQLDRLNTLVLDEADRMLDMGFFEEVSEIVQACPTEKNTWMFSATFPEEIRALAQEYVPSYDVIESEDQAPVSLSHYRVVSEPDQKIYTLERLLSHLQPETCIIFCRTKKDVGDLAHELRTQSYSADAISSELDQFQRNLVLARFRNQSIRILVATDVAARGIDVPSIDLVIHLDSCDYETYVHRSGRTARAGREGKSVIFSSSDRELPAPWNQIPFELVTLGEETRRPLKALFSTIMIRGGRKNKVRPGDILGALTGGSEPLKGTQVGKIEIHDQYSFVAVEREQSELATRKLDREGLKGKKFPVQKIS